MAFRKIVTEKTTEETFLSYSRAQMVPSNFSERHMGSALMEYKYIKDASSRSEKFKVKS